MLSNVSVAPNRNKLPHYVHLAGTGCTHLLALYWLMVFIHETHVMPSSGKVKTKMHLFSYLSLAGSEYCPFCKLLQTGTNYHISWYWYCLHPCSGIILINSVIHEKHVMPPSGKVETKRHLFSYLVIADSECWCPMCQLFQTGTNYHITYIWLLQVAPILWYYIDWWCLFMKRMWCHLVAK